jgi:hypothetical protein
MQLIMVKIEGKGHSPYVVKIQLERMPVVALCFFHDCVLQAKYLNEVSVGDDWDGPS